MSRSRRVSLNYFGNVGVVRMLNEMMGNFVGYESMSASISARHLMRYISTYTARVRKESESIRESLKSIQERVTVSGLVVNRVFFPR
jgi:hypothetical protein